MDITVMANFMAAGYHLFANVGECVHRVACVR